MVVRCQGDANNMRGYQSEVIYQIDQNDFLVFFNDQWDLFAQDNDGPHLKSENIYNRKIWDFIHDAETRHLHETLLKRVRSNNTILNMPFRCDSPTLRRFMEMDILLQVDGKIEYRCRVIKTQLRNAVQVVAGNIQEERPFLRMCSWCKKIDVGNNSWVEIEDGIAFLGLLSQAIVPQISHTICEICLGDLEDDE